MGADAFGQTVEGEAAPLMMVAQALDVPVIGAVVTITAITAMLGVLLNLILGLSRVVLSMARHRDLPRTLATINSSTQSPAIAVWVTGLIIGLLVLSGDVVFTWSFSAFTVLIYYAITNLSALRMPKELQLYPRWIPVSGLAGCLFLSFWIEPLIWLIGTGLLIAGILWHMFTLRYRKTAARDYHDRIPVFQAQGRQGIHLPHYFSSNAAASTSSSTFSTDLGRVGSSLFPGFKPYVGFRLFANRTSDSIIGTSISTPTTVTRAAPD